MDVEVVYCQSASKSPTGQLPALEQDAEVSQPSANEHAAARSCLQLARRIHDLDTHLSLPQKAELLAFTSLIQQRLETATEYSIWIENSGYAEYCKATFSSQPFPLNTLIPWSTRREMRNRHGHLSSEVLYQEACEVLAAVADKLRVSGGRYLFGGKPSSLDALLFGHLLFYREAPAAAPVLKAKVATTPILCDFLDHVLTTAFAGVSVGMSQGSGSAGVHSQRSSQRGTSSTRSSGKEQQQEGQGEGGGASSSWSEGAKGASGRKAPKPVEVTAAERAFQRKSWIWLAGAGLVTLGYVLFSGKYIELDQLSAAFGAGDVDDDEQDEEEEEAEDE